jgi:hypothetical protein
LVIDNKIKTACNVSAETGRRSILINVLRHVSVVWVVVRFEVFNVHIMPQSNLAEKLADSGEEEAMAPSSEEKLELLTVDLLRGVRCLATDYIDMEYLFEGDPEAQAEVTAVRLTAEAQAHRVIAEAADKIAQIVSKKKS